MPTGLSFRRVDFWCSGRPVGVLTPQPRQIRRLRGILRGHHAPSRRPSPLESLPMPPSDIPPRPLQRCRRITRPRPRNHTPTDPHHRHPPQVQIRPVTRRRPPPPMPRRRHRCLHGVTTHHGVPRTGTLGCFSQRRVLQSGPPSVREPKQPTDSRTARTPTYPFATCVGTATRGG